ncbi:hypothetical protein CYMTET_24693 [Cymbomonas tetramitiformis]|uniref:Transmembrane protein n=1 Tax=Cymbomonas tetramitiformis TaxID=36881 RepID=A0AAE0KZZ3_9CHLO|nr:hypothetical protein CYMTET_24693 [Cymbomonas tetramitiformis]
MRRMQSLMEESQKQMQQGSAETYRRESKSERTFEGGYERRYYSESVTIYGAPAPYTTYQAPPAEGLTGALLAASLVGAVIAAYAAGAVRFLRGYDNTRFKRAKKWQLALLWPVLILFSRSFREEFWFSVRRGGSGTREPVRKDLTGPEDLGPASTAQRVER